MNVVGVYYLTRREIHRFMKVINQSIFPPIVSSLIFLIIFSFVLGRTSEVSGVNYLEFLVPGLVMMAIINNVFSNSAFSVFISKFSNHFSHLLIMPLSYFELTLGYVLGALVRGLLTAVSIIIAVAFFVNINIHNWFIVIIYFTIASVLFSSLGVLGALWSKQFDHLGIFTTFLLTPLTMLGGVFYSTNNLPEVFQTATLFNPIFYLVDGFRYGMIGVKDTSILLGISVTSTMALGAFILTVHLMKKGWRVKQ